MRLLPFWGHPGAIQPSVGSLSGASQGRDNLRSRKSGNLILEAHGGILPEKKKSAMQKKELAKCPHCRHITRMTTNDMSNQTTVTIDLGNNESLTRGVFQNPDGTFTALTFSRSKDFKTKAGAIRWFKKATGQG